VLDSIIWAFKHTMRNVADTGLNILLQLLQVPDVYSSPYCPKKIVGQSFHLVMNKISSNTKMCPINMSGQMLRFV
jgi:hypothetical protein